MYRTININRKSKKLIERDIKQELNINITILDLDKFQEYCNSTIRNYLMEVCYPDKLNILIERIKEVSTPWNAYSFSVTKLTNQWIIDEVNVKFLRKLIDNLIAQNIVSINNIDKTYNKITQKNAYKILLLENLLKVIENSSNIEMESVYSDSVIYSMIWDIVVEHLIKKGFISKSLFIEKYGRYKFKESGLSYINTKECIEKDGINLNDNEINQIEEEFKSYIQEEILKNEIFEYGEKTSYFNIQNRECSESFFTEEEINQILSL